MRFWTVLLTLLASSAWGVTGGQPTTVVRPVTTAEDSRGFCAKLISQMPSININEGVAFGPVDLSAYATAGDVRVTASPVYADLAPTVTLGGTAVANDTLNTTDVNHPLYSIADTAADVSGSLTFTYHNTVAGCSNLVMTVPIVINDTTTPSTEIPIPVGGATVVGGVPHCDTGKYFVDPGGSNSNDGCTSLEAAFGSHGPWKDLPKVNGFVFLTGEDVWLKAGASFAAGTLVVDWSGTSLDRVVVGSYYVDASGQPFELHPDDPTALANAFVYTNGARPIVQGSFTPACLAAKSCIMGAGAIPGGQYAGLVGVAANTNYVTVQGLDLRYSAGTFITAETNAANFLALENTGYIAAAGMLTVKGDNSIVRSNYFHIWGRCKQAGFVPVGAVDNCSGSGEPPGVIVVQPADHALIERNVVLTGFGEAMNCLKSGFNIYRNNIAGGMRGPGVYMDNCGDTLVEHNIVVGTYGSTDQVGKAFPSNATGTGIQVNLETTGQASLAHSDRNVIRNNLIAGVGKCLGVKGYNGSYAYGGTVKDNKYYGNTCVEPVGVAFAAEVDTSAGGGNDTYAVQWTGNQFKNNIVYASGLSSAAACSFSPSNTAGSQVVLDYNLWYVAPTAKCIGTHDVVGNPNLAGSNFAQYGVNNIPDFDDFKWVSGAASNAGTPLQTTILSTAAGALSQYLNITAPCATPDLKANALDYGCTARSVVTPDIGAYETP